MWSMITHDHDHWNWVKKYLQSLMIVIWSEMIGDHDPISPTLEYMGPNGFVIKQVPIPMYQFLDWDPYIKIATLGPIWIYGSHIFFFFASNKHL